MPFPISSYGTTGVVPFPINSYGTTEVVPFPISFYGTTKVVPFPTCTKVPGFLCAIPNGQSERRLGVGERRSRSGCGDLRVR
jgi:hypothetical protein